ncbi:MAG: hypothetical protein ACD_59C00004G0004 [uncultured bacterium]|nr:MAG: hypothetical protein ACD_59C00004G0004 [uncultured bacterium]
MKKNSNEITELTPLYKKISSILENARKNAYRAIDNTMVLAYWHIGRLIVENEQKGSFRAEYGKAVIGVLSARLIKKFGRGFDERNLWYMKQFYIYFQNMNALRSELSWTHYRLILRVENEDARNFYVIETVKNNWSTRELDRQISTLLFERIALSKSHKKVKELAVKGQEIRKADDIIKDPYVLEFLDLKKNAALDETTLESALIDKLEEFLLELGRGFSFIARQKRITIDGDHYYIDLVFYNYILKCFFLIDLKMGKLTHQDIGQMDFYVRYFEEEEKIEGDNPAIGLILCADKNDAMVKYTLLKGNKKIFASKYKLYLPSEDELRREILREKEIIEREKRLLIS